MTKDEMAGWRTALIIVGDDGLVQVPTSTLRELLDGVEALERAKDVFASAAFWPERGTLEWDFIAAVYSAVWNTPPRPQGEPE